MISFSLPSLHFISQSALYLKKKKNVTLLQNDNYYINQQEKKPINHRGRKIN